MRLFFLYWHTIRHLRIIQILWRPWFKLYKPLPDKRTPPVTSSKTKGWKECARRKPSLVGPTTFSFLNEVKTLEEIGWHSKNGNKLWLYNLHYFDDLNAFGASSRSSWHLNLICDWIDKNPPAFSIGWEPYPTSLRIVNWIKWAMVGNQLPEQAYHSLAVQTRFLLRRLEYHLLGNHLLANAKALIFSGLFFDGKEADRWLYKGLTIYRSELKEQILADGGHFELSTMYHSIIFEDILDICNMMNCYSHRLKYNGLDLKNRLQEIAGKMLCWLQAMCHPDGDISFFNDSAFGISPSPIELSGYFQRVLNKTKTSKFEQIKYLSESGYIRAQLGKVVAHLDVGRIGPEYLMGHAHADTLTFELSYNKQRLIVNTGTSCYGLSKQRLKQRGTAAHNTVIIENNNSSEIWDSFRVAKRAYPGKVKIQNLVGTEGIVVSCSHNGYFRLEPDLMHTRSWEILHNSISILDKIENKQLSAYANFHFHPDVFVSMDNSGYEGIIKLKEKVFATFIIYRGKPLIKKTTWHPEFGTSVQNQCLCLKLEHGEGNVKFQFADN